MNFVLWSTVMSLRFFKNFGVLENEYSDGMFHVNPGYRQEGHRDSVL